MRRAAVFGVAMVIAGACAPQTAEPGRLEVVAAFYPLAEAAERVGGEDVRVINLTPPGAEPHDFELSPADLDALIDADLILYLGRGFQPGIEEALDRSDAARLDVLQGFDEGTLDPHVWLDPSRWARVQGRIADALASLDEGRAGAFRARADDYVQELRSLDEAFAEGLGDCERTLIVTSHAAFGYLAQRYELEERAVSGIAPEAEPDPARLAELAELVEREGVTTVFTESSASPEIAETLARETGAEVATLDPIESLSAEQIEHSEDYESVMRDNLEALRDGLGCS